MPTWDLLFKYLIHDNENSHWKKPLECSVEFFDKQGRQAQPTRILDLGSGNGHRFIHLTRRGIISSGEHYQRSILLRLLVRP